MTQTAYYTPIRFQKTVCNLPMKNISSFRQNIMSTSFSQRCVGNLTLFALILSDIWEVESTILLFMPKLTLSTTTIMLSKKGTSNFLEMLDVKYSHLF